MRGTRDPLRQLRKIYFALPQAMEKIARGEPIFRVRGNGLSAETAYGSSRTIGSDRRIREYPAMDVVDSGGRPRLCSTGTAPC